MPEDELLDALRGLGADHEPDVAAIRRRMEEKRPKVVPLRRRVDDAPRKRPVLLSAAAALLIGGGVTAAVSQMGPAGNQTPSSIPVTVPTFVSPEPSVSADPSPSVENTREKEKTPDGASASSSPATPRSEGSEKENPATASSSSPSGPQNPAADDEATSTQAGISVQALNSGQALTLGDADEDWLAIGVRNDLKTVRKKASDANPLLNFTAPPSAASVDGPFSLSWSGGKPEQDRANTTRWLQTDGAVVTVTASSAARTVTLYTGNLMNVVVSGEDLKQQRAELGGTAMGYKVTVTIPSHSGETTIDLESGRGPVHLLAATASTS
ncbi:hypothetical protein [Kineosporia succinea]|uniref:Uncharacterized protein n=1 Tax=Kineosporia succinea TaxID=84632 RepID=A0ABT9P2K0_9ACTN|nr:hypothetical protein [Kineosporia succinea]MDP9826786.1 hypothetical protein [Kineosporia succinea]